MRENDDYRRTAYVFVTTQPGKTRSVVRGIAGLQFSGCRTLTVEPVIGEFDVIVKIEGQDIDSLARALFCGIQDMPGVTEVVASLCVDEIPTPRATPCELAAPNVVSVAHN